MGRYENEQDSYATEDPQRTVNIGQVFYMGKYVVTKRQWEALMGTTPWSGEFFVLAHLDSPAVYISWNDAQAFVTALNAHLVATGQATGVVRLPSESEWEYAARAGTTTRYYWGDDPDYRGSEDFAWHWDHRTGAYAEVVGQKLPNAWGLYDVSGTVTEFCQDWYHNSYTDAPTDGSAWESPVAVNRVRRGGSWENHPGDCRSASRDSALPTATNAAMGFRLALSPLNP